MAASKTSTHKTKKPRVKQAPNSDLSSQVMEQILSGQVKMKPKSYFVAGSVLMATGLAVFFALAVFFFNHFFFHFFQTGMLDFWRMRGFSHVLWEVFPWWSLVLAALFVSLGAWLVHQYDISYKRNYKFLVLGLLLVAITFGYIMNLLGVNKVIMKQRPMRCLYLIDRAGRDWLVGWVLRVDADDQKLVVQVGDKQILVYYSEQTQMPLSQISPGQLVRLVGRFTDEAQTVFQAEAIGLGPKHQR